ncbi:FOG: Transposase [Streptomyces chartreusis NRRL 3882]|uniref:FOG: Transposase n=1 Tax=Streptomyces chartreusis NRRL 3882 TaxID=1079985 RepID=A0A2N9AZU4_STRCX|nr:FOG: Transposase [Streptomyces chartreusis NRRL 3882]
MARIAGRFSRVEPRATARAYLLGLLSHAERKNCWQPAEQAGHARPGPMQRLLRCARWDADAVRDDIRAYAVEHLGAQGAVLIVDETGFVKKGRASAGVQRQYTGTAGRIENSQVGVFLAYATSRGRTLIDRRLYLPEQSWCSDPGRRQAAGIPETVQFQTKPRLAWEMIAAALDAGVEAPWVTGDEAYGQDPQLRAALEARGTGYVMAVACSTRVRINSGRTTMRADTVAERLPASAWQRHSAGNGAKGPRYYDWAWIHIGTDGHRHLLVRRNRTTGELAFYLCWSPTEVTLAELVRVAGVRWSVEECFQAAKGQVGLDHYQVRNWTSWHRHITLAMLALAFLTALAADAAPDRPIDPHHPARGSDPITLTVPEIRRLLVVALNPRPCQRPGSCTGPHGSDATKQQPAAATTDNGQLTNSLDRSRNRTGVLVRYKSFV